MPKAPSLPGTQCHCSITSSSLVTPLFSLPHLPEVTLSLWKTGESDHGIVAGSVGQADQSHSTTWHFEVTLPNTGAGSLPPVPSTLPALFLGLAEVGQADVGFLKVTVLGIQGTQLYGIADPVVGVLFLLLLGLKEWVVVSSPAVTPGCSRGG